MSLYFILGAALGAMLRFAFERNAVKHWGESFPWGTLTANLMGSLLLGLVWNQDHAISSVVFLISFCGAFTTFGGFISQTHVRVRHTQTRALGWIYSSVTVFGSLGAAALGLALGS